MAAVRFAPAALRDLEDIWLYLVQHAGVAVADDWLEKIESRARQLDRFSKSGQSRPDIGKNVRCLVVGRWLVLYRSGVLGTAVIRIIDGARDLQSLKFNED